jgi:hypothetical protein
MELITQRNQQASFEGPAIHVGDILSQIKDINLMNRHLVESIYGMSSISSRSVNKHGRHKPFLFLIG